MPTYEYKCDACGHEFEKFQPITSSPVKKCPDCGKNKVRRLISAGAGLIFKGSGFYITDYRSEGYKDSAKKAEGDGKPAETKTTDGKTESKPAETKTSESKAAESKPAEPKPVESKPAPKAEVPQASKSARKK